MWLVVASTSLEIADEDALRQAHVLDIHMSRGRKLRVDSAMSEDDIAFYAGVAVDKINYIKDGADFVLISSPSNQRLAYELQASAIVSYLNCCLLNEEVAEPETLLAWLQDIMDNDDLSPMADVTLASVALRSLALICSLNPASTSVVSRMLTAFIVSDTPRSETIAVASKSLATILKMLSKDSVISTLYTLGNELSPQSETAFISDQTNGHAIDGTEGFETRNSDDSNASLPNEAEKAALIHGNVVQAICGIATACEDEQITALAQSVLLQKLDKINTAVDAKIVVGAADLALTGGLQEFRSLLKLYARMSHNGVVDNKEYLLNAVSVSSD
jgi:phosphatidylinositol 4-kinase A